MQYNGLLRARSSASFLIVLAVVQIFRLCRLAGTNPDAKCLPKAGKKMKCQWNAWFGATQFWSHSCFLGLYNICDAPIGNQHCDPLLLASVCSYLNKCAIRFLLRGPVGRHILCLAYVIWRLLNVVLSSPGLLRNCSDF